MGDLSSLSSDDSFSYTNVAARAFKAAKKKIAATKPLAKLEYVVDLSSDSDSEQRKSEAVPAKRTRKSKPKSSKHGTARKCKRHKTSATKDNHSERPLNVDILDDYSSCSDSVENGSLLSISPVRLSPKPVDTTPASKFGRFDVFDSDENNSDSSVKVVMTVSDSSDVEVITASNGPAECGNEERYDENELISIKISWKLQPVEKFQLRRHQKFKTLMDHFAKLEGVPLQKIVIYGGKDCTRLIEPFDTPDTVGVTVTDVLEGGVLSEGGESRATRVRGLAGQHIGDGITVRVQVEGVRSFPVMIGRQQKMHVLMVKVAEQMEVDVSRVKLSLDGEAIAPDSNAKDLDLEEGDVLDLRLL